MFFKSLDILELETLSNSLCSSFSTYNNLAVCVLKTFRVLLKSVISVTKELISDLKFSKLSLTWFIKTFLIISFDSLAIKFFNSFLDVLNFNYTKH